MKIIMDKGTDKEITEVCETLDIRRGNEPFLRVGNGIVKFIDRQGKVFFDVSDVSDDRLINLFIYTFKNKIFKSENTKKDMNVWELIHVDVPHKCSKCGVTSKEVGYKYFSDGSEPRYFCPKCRPDG